MTKRFDDLPDETKDFLSGLRPDEVILLKDGLRLVQATQIVGRFVKWVIIGLLGILAGFIMFWESIGKILKWLGQAG